ncbi:unnamed protein product [Linum tenue]|uniref:Uncharacterized protein n=1 Tax=Linum tenue TaxID=586396 RepID=A0AAV0IXK5_9ROSI|nr:unnamed protein product [Linum tenue]
MEEEHVLDEKNNGGDPTNNSPSSAQGTGARKLFSTFLIEEEWYVAESDSDDVAEAIREDDLDDEIPEDDNPRCPTIPFKALEKQRYRRTWSSALIVIVLVVRSPSPSSRNG